MHKEYHNLTPEKKETFFIIIAILLLIVIFIVAFVLPDQCPIKIKQKLEERGYSIADIDFTRTTKFSNIYKSSQPIEISDGNTCEYWQIVSYGSFIAVQEVFPYPDGWPKPISVSITLEPEEYQELLKSAGKESIESYIKDKLLNEEPE